MLYFIIIALLSQSLLPYYNNKFSFQSNNNHQTPLSTSISINMSDKLKVAVTAAVKKCYYCYIIYSGNKTYTGYTVDLKRRMRQHNKEIKGGARSTSSSTDWQYLSIMTSSSWTCNSDAMKVEYIHKHPTRKKYRPGIYSKPSGRIKSLNEICKHINVPITLYIHSDYYNDVYRDLALFGSQVEVKLLEDSVLDVI